jgi:DUF1707 SHOCT-like domain
MAAGRGDAPEAGRGRLRASHADREQVIGTLKAAFVQGMLAKDEFDQRVGQAFAARTHAELTAVTADFPANLAPLPPLKPVRAQDEQPVLRPGLVLAAATTLYAGVWALALIPSWPLDSEGDPPKVIIRLVFLTTLMYLLVLAIAAGNMIGGWCEKRSGKPSLPGQGEQFPDGLL